MLLRQQDSVCAQIIPCSSGLFSIFLNRHCRESRIRNGPVISLIASTDKSKMGKIFKRHNWFHPKCSSRAPSSFSPTMACLPLPSSPHTPGLGWDSNGRQGCPPDKTVSAQWRPELGRGRPGSWRQHVLGHPSSHYPEADPKSNPKPSIQEQLDDEGLPHSKQTPYRPRVVFQYT